MSFPNRNRGIYSALPLTLILVLGILAFLQVRWSGQVSDAATTRIHADLQNSLMNFRQDVSRTFAVMCVELEPDRHRISDDPRVLSQKLDHWKRTSRFPGLIKNLYLWDASTQGSPSLLHLPPAEARFEAIPWPDSMRDLRNSLTSEGFSIMPHLFPPHGPADREDSTDHHVAFHHDEFRPPLMAGIDESIPVLLFPAQDNRTLLLIQLDPDVLNQGLLPELASRYFGDPRNSSYKVAVIADHNSRPQLLYTSDRSLNMTDLHPDGALNLFGPPNWGLHSANSPQSSSNANTTTAVLPPADAQAAVRFEPISSAQGRSDWQVIVEDKQGSVESAVAAMRYRNLALSFGVLLLLALSMALIVHNSHRAQKLAALQMDFIAGVSHELRTPVASILSTSENMADGVVRTQQQMARYGTLITNQARQLNHLIEQVLRFSATQKRTTTYSIRPVAVSRVIAKVLENTDALASASGVKIETTEEPNLPLVLADFGAFVQCVQNLVTNAIKYCGEPKWVGIRGHYDAARGEVIVSVEDRGIGIEKSDLRHIFEPFYRSPKVAESRVHGTGLGLALVREFANAIGARITVESEAGRGSSFNIHLSKATGMPKTQEQNPEAPQRVSESVAT